MNPFAIAIITGSLFYIAEILTIGIYLRPSGTEGFAAAVVGFLCGYIEIVWQRRLKLVKVKQDRDE